MFGKKDSKDQAPREFKYSPDMLDGLTPEQISDLEVEAYELAKNWEYSGGDQLTIKFENLNPEQQKLLDVLIYKCGGNNEITWYLNQTLSRVVLDNHKIIYNPFRQSNMYNTEVYKFGVTPIVEKRIQESNLLISGEQKKESVRGLLNERIIGQHTRFIFEDDMAGVTVYRLLKEMLKMDKFKDANPDFINHRAGLTDTPEFQEYLTKIVIKYDQEDIQENNKILIEGVNHPETIDYELIKECRKPLLEICRLTGNTELESYFKEAFQKVDLNGEELIDYGVAIGKSKGKKAQFEKIKDQTGFAGQIRNLREVFSRQKTSEQKYESEQEKIADLNSRYEKQKAIVSEIVADIYTKSLELIGQKPAINKELEVTESTFESVDTMRTLYDAMDNPDILVNMDGGYIRLISDIDKLLIENNSPELQEIQHEMKLINRKLELQIYHLEESYKEIESKQTEIAAMEQKNKPKQTESMKAELGNIRTKSEEYRNNIKTITRYIIKLIEKSQDTQK